MLSSIYLHPSAALTPSSISFFVSFSSVLCIHPLILVCLPFAFARLVPSLRVSLLWFCPSSLSCTRTLPMSPFLFLSPFQDLSSSHPLFLSCSLSLFLYLSPCLYLLPSLSLSLLLFAVCSFPSHFPALLRVEPLRLALPKLSRSRFKIIQLAPDHHPPPSLSRPRQRCRRLCRHPQGRSSSLVHRRVSAAPVTFR